jgi:hypothetical protein
MHVLFYRRDGSEQCSRQYTSPGRFHFGQDSMDHDFPHGVREGEVMNFHVGHGVYRDYVVEAVDDKTVFLRQQ